MRSREGRHTATASTWMLRFGMVKDRDKAIKFIKRGKVQIKGRKAETRVGYYRPKKEDFKIID